MRWLEHLCIQYLEGTINPQNVLEALKYASHLKLFFLKEFCLKFITKESSYTQIVMSKEFECLEQPLMVEIVRRRQIPRCHIAPEPMFENTSMIHGNFCRNIYCYILRPLFKSSLNRQMIYLLQWLCWNRIWHSFWKLEEKISVISHSCWTRHL